MLDNWQIHKHFMSLGYHLLCDVSCLFHRIQLCFLFQLFDLLFLFFLQLLQFFQQLLVSVKGSLLLLYEFDDSLDWLKILYFVIRSSLLLLLLGESNSILILFD